LGNMFLVMPIFEYACPPCLKIFQFLSKRLKPTRNPVCPQCGNRRLVKEISQFAALKSAPDPNAGGVDAEGGMPDFDNPRMQHALREMERDWGAFKSTTPSTWLT